MDDFNARCKEMVDDIAETCEAIAYGNAYISKDGELKICEYEVSDWSEVEDFDHEADFWDYLADNYNERYILNENGEILGAKFMVACGGPNIWVDSYEEEVHLYWGTTEARMFLTKDCCEKIDNFAIDYHKFRITM